MEHALYFVVPHGRFPLIDGIAAQLWESSERLERVGCVVESDADRDSLRNSELPYDQIDLAPDLSPEATRDSTPRSSRSADASLPRLRSKYGRPFLSPFAVADARYDDEPRKAWMRLVERAFGYFEEVIEAFDPTMVVTPNVSRPFEWVPAQIAEEHGTYIWWKTARVGKQYGLIEGNHTDDFCGFEEAAQGDLSENRARVYLSDVRKKGSKPDFYSRRADSYDRSIHRVVFPHGIPSAETVLSALRADESGATDFDDQRLPELKNVVRRLRIHAADMFESPRPDEQFLFFPLHAQPESSTRIIAPTFENQRTLAEQIARSLPTDRYLYIKDHPRMFRDHTRPPSYYRELASIPGVRVLDPNRDSHELIKQSEAVLSVVGTPAMEAAFFRIPSIVFGSVHFARLPSVQRCRSLEDLPEMLSWALSEPDCNDEDLQSYLAALFECTFEIPTDASGSDPDAQRRKAKSIAPQLREQIDGDF